MNDLLLEKDASSLTYQEIKNAGDLYWESHDKEAKGSGYKPFMRWLETAKAFVKPDGTLQTNSEIQLEIQKFQTLGTNSDPSNWMPMGPFSYTNSGSWSAGQGRVNSMTIDPSNPNIYYIGTPGGGTWKSTDAGVTWTPLNDYISRVGSSAVAVDPNNSNIVYVGTGDDDGGDAPSIGLLKSTDGGLSFNPTGLSFPDALNANISEVYLDPVNSNKLVVASSRGLYISNDAGASFNRTLFGNIKDIKFKPGDSNTIYLSTSNSFHRSTNGGNSWDTIFNGLPSNMGRSVIAVTPANDNYVYLLIINSQANLVGVFRSTNSGLSFNRRDNGTDILESGQGWYDLALEASPTNPNVIYTGCLNMWKSSNGGSSFNKMNFWNRPNDPDYVHADIHQIRQFGNELFALTDGGVYRSTNDGSSFTDLTAGAQIGQFYRVAVGQSSADLAGGLQDNGGFVRSNNTWKNFHGADGMEAGINPNNSNTRYAFTQFGGGLYFTLDGVNNAGSIQGPEQGNWITPLKTDSQGIIYAGYSRLYKIDGGNSFMAVSNSFGQNIDLIEIDPNDDSQIYVAVNENLFRSTDSGANFSFVQSFGINISAIEVNGNDSNTIYVATSGAFGDVYRSTNNGSSFSDITYNLPRLGKNTLAHQPLNAIENLYVGTSAGIYRLEGNSTQWELFNTNLPNSSVRDLEINTNDGIITAATYGRGVWQSDIPVVSPQSDVSLSRIVYNGGVISCSSDSIALEVRNNGLSPITQLVIDYQIGAATVISNQVAVNIPAGTSDIVSLPSISFPLGVTDFTVEINTANDAFSSNNIRTTQISLNQTGTLNDTFGFANRDFLVEENSGGSNTWERGVPNGFVLNTAGSGNNNTAYATNLNGNHGDNVRSYLISGCYDLTGVSAPFLSFEMAFDIEENWDLLYMEYSIDSGSTWNLLGSAADSNWYNSSRTPNGQNCFNCVGGQWTGSATGMNTYSKSLDFLTTESNVIFRYSFVTDRSVTEEGAVIDNFVITGTLSNRSGEIEDLISIYPNPSSGIFNIQWNDNRSFDYKIFDVSGKLIQNRIDNKGLQHQIELSSAASGIYFLEITSGTGSVTKKLMKK